MNQPLLLGSASFFFLQVRTGIFGFGADSLFLSFGSLDLGERRCRRLFLGGGSQKRAGIEMQDVGNRVKAEDRIADFCLVTVVPLTYQNCDIHFYPGCGDSCATAFEVPILTTRLPKPAEEVKGQLVIQPKTGLPTNPPLNRCGWFQASHVFSQEGGCFLWGDCFFGGTSWSRVDPAHRLWVGAPKNARRRSSFQAAAVRCSSVPPAFGTEHRVEEIPARATEAERQEASCRNLEVSKRFQNQHGLLWKAGVLRRVDSCGSWTSLAFLPRISGLRLITRGLSTIFGGKGRWDQFIQLLWYLWESPPMGAKVLKAFLFLLYNRSGVAFPFQTFLRPDAKVEIIGSPEIPSRSPPWIASVRLIPQRGSWPNGSWSSTGFPGRSKCHICFCGFEESANDKSP